MTMITATPANTHVTIRELESGGAPRVMNRAANTMSTSASSVTTSVDVDRDRPADGGAWTASVVAVPQR
jgi:hypothetical protein